jgi:putative sterol carrier protein
MKYTCQCCGYKTHTNQDNLWEICEICYWQTCPIDNVEVTTIVGPNPISLIEAQHNFIRFGACDKSMIKNVRKPKEDEPKDENWRDSFSNNYLVQKFKLTQNWNASWNSIIYNINEENLKEKGLFLTASNKRFSIDIEYNKNPDECVLNIKEGQLLVERLKYDNITEVIEKTNYRIVIIDKKIIEIEENKTDEKNHIEKNFDIRVRIENQIYPAKLTLWMNYDYEIEKI